MKRRFECTTGGSQKFWEVEVAGASLVVRFGRIGTNGQTKASSRPSRELATSEAERLVREKTAKGYREVSKGVRGTQAAPPPALDDLSALDALLGKSRLPYVELRAKRKRQLPPWASKAADAPYLPLGVPWPRRGKEPLRPLLQIDFQAMPALPGFPKKGLASFFVSEDLTAHRVLFFPKVERDVKKLQSDFSFLDWEDVHDLSPFGGPAELSFGLREGSVSWEDHRFQGIVGKKRLDALYDSPRYAKIHRHVTDLAGATNRIGGYATPGQDDPRARAKRRAYETLLLQVADDNFTLCFFIRPQALERGDFSDVLFDGSCD